MPFGLLDQAEVGCRVAVQFGRKKVLTGVIFHLHEQPPVQYEAKSILDVLDDVPHINAYQLALFQWMADYYMCHLGEVLNQALPSGLKLSSESRIQIHPQFDPASMEDENFSDKEQRLLVVLEREGVLTYSEAADILEMKTYVNIIRSLLDKGAVLIFEELREKFSPKKETRIRLNEEFVSERKAIETLMDDLDKKPGQQQVLLAYLQQVPLLTRPEANAAGAEQKGLIAKGISRSSLNTLIKKGIFDRYEVVVSRFRDLGPDVAPDFALTDIQKETKEAILRQFQDKQTVLLHGVTGSGKTEIYIELIREVLTQGGQVLYLLPEIALTTQIVSRLRLVFGDSMGVYHSRYSDNERVEVWEGVLEGRFELVIGVRSAVFLPFDNLNLIIIDEEHETSYKQFDKAPRYNARDVSQVMAQIHHARVLLGSATPSLESYYLASGNKYGLVELNERYGSSTLPDIIFADMRSERKEKRAKGDFSSILIEQARQVLAKGEQIIIFQNRRGYSPYITCEECSWIPKCPHCAVSLTYHMYSHQLRCHYCGFYEPLPAACNACGSTRLRTVGTGTEKLEEDLRVLIPEARIQRMDLDTTRRKYSYQKIINDFEEGDIDILVGTQMVTKGLDFDKVSLVGVFDLDRMMHFPDFRAAERAFQLSVQVSGRAGRKDLQGSVIIQTADLQQPILKHIAFHHYQGFYDSELTERKRFRYPPFFRLIKITCKHRDKDMVNLAVAEYYRMLIQNIKKEWMLAPHEPLISKIRNMYLMDIIIKLERGKVNLENVKRVIRERGQELVVQKSFRQLVIVWDVDPF